MRKPLVTVFAILFANFVAPIMGHAQQFKVEKVDIKGDGGTDYVAVESATGRVFVSRANHMMVVEGATGKVLGDISNTPGVHASPADFCNGQNSKRHRLRQQHRQPVCPDFQHVAQ